jgi:hypothetical protein
VTSTDEIIALRQAPAAGPRRLQSVIDLAGGPMCNVESDRQAIGELVFVRADDAAHRLVCLIERPRAAPQVTPEP